MMEPKIRVKNYYKPKVIMSIHGYNSTGKWQDKLSECLIERGLKSSPYKYGRKIIKVLPYHISRNVDKFKDWYFETVRNPELDLKIDEPFHRPSIMAHSLGTWILVKMLSKYPEVKFDKIFLFGSIVPADFDWFKLILRDQIGCVIYEKAMRDKIVPLGLIFTRSLKPCGRNGFTQKCSFVKEETFGLFGHSDFQYKEHLFNYLDKRLFENPHQLTTLHGRDLSESEVAKIFKTTLNIDKDLFPLGHEGTPISIETALIWFKIERDIWSFVKSSYNKSVLGYINAVPVDDEVYNAFCKGEIDESEINPSNMVNYDGKGKFNLLILSVAIKRNIRGEESTLLIGRIAEMLIMSFMYKLELCNAGNRLKKMAAYVWSPEGERLCKRFCMKKTGRDKSGHNLYEVDIQKITTDDLKDANFMSKWWYKKHLRL
jgi:hypothetical protein